MGRQLVNGSGQDGLQTGEQLISRQACLFCELVYGVAAKRFCELRLFNLFVGSGLNPGVCDLFLSASSEAVQQVAQSTGHCLTTTAPTEQSTQQTTKSSSVRAWDAYRLPYVQRLLPVLVPELSVWGELKSGNLLAGRVDAIAIEDGKVLEVLDWKSDRDTSLHRAAYVHQLQRYLHATSAPRGAIVFMTTGEVVPVLPPH